MSSTAKGGRVNPQISVFNRDYQDMVKILNRQQPIKQLKQSVGVGSYLVSKRMTTGTIIATRLGCTKGHVVPCENGGQKVCGESSCLPENF
jgi:hypothetical protein